MACPAVVHYILNYILIQSKSFKKEKENVSVLENSEGTANAVDRSVNAIRCTVIYDIGRLQGMLLVLYARNQKQYFQK